MSKACPDRPSPRRAGRMPPANRFIFPAASSRSALCSPSTTTSSFNNAPRISAAFLGRPANAVLGQPLDALLGEAASAVVQTAFADLPPDVLEDLGDVGAGERLPPATHVLIHNHDGVRIIEFVPEGDGLHGGATVRPGKLGRTSSSNRCSKPR